MSQQIPHYLQRAISLQNYRSVFGFCATVTRAAVADVWPPGGRMLYFTDHRSVRVASTSAADTTVGAGAYLVRFVYLDSSFAEHTAQVTLTGTTPVVLPQTDIMRIQRADVIAANSDGTGRFRNVGVITFVDIATTEIMAQIEAGFNSSLQSHFTVPASYYGLLDYAFCETGSVAAEARASLAIRPPGGVFNIKWPFFAYRGEAHRQVLEVVPPTWDIAFKAVKIGAGSTEISAGYRVHLIRTEQYDAIVNRELGLF